MGPDRDADGHRIWRDVRGKKYPSEDATAARRERDRIVAAPPDARGRLIADAQLTTDNRPLAAELAELRIGLLEADIPGFLVATEALASVQPRTFQEVEVARWLLHTATPAIGELFLRALADDVRTTDLPAIARLAREISSLLADQPYVVWLTPEGAADDADRDAVIASKVKALEPALAILRSVSDHEFHVRVNVPTRRPWNELLADAEAAIREFSFERQYVRAAIFAATLLHQFDRAVALYEKYSWATIRVADGKALVDDECLANLVACYTLTGRATQGLERLEPVLASIDWDAVQNAGLFGNLAEAYALADDVDTAADFAERMLRAGDPALGWAYIEREQSFDGIRTSAEFQELKKTFG